MNKDKCPACQQTDLVHVWQTVAGVRRIRSLCGQCGWHLGWPEQTPEKVASADAAEKPTQQVLF